MYLIIERHLNNIFKNILKKNKKYYFLEKNNFYKFKLNLFSGLKYQKYAIISKKIPIFLF
jgi:hypothetical protein